MFKKDFDKRVYGSACEHIFLMSTLVDILPGMLNVHNLEILSPTVRLMYFSCHK